jgi:hypothetical protein
LKEQAVVKLAYRMNELEFNGKYNVFQVFNVIFSP